MTSLLLGRDLGGVNRNHQGATDGNRSWTTDGDSLHGGLGRNNVRPDGPDQAQRRQPPDLYRLRLHRSPRRPAERCRSQRHSRRCQRSFYGGAAPLIDSPFLFASAAAVALGAKGVAASAIWRERGGSDQDIAIDIRKAFQRFSGFADGRWELVNGRPPSPKWNK